MPGKPVSSSVVSGDPEALFRYADVTEEIDVDLLKAVQPLRDALAQFARSCTEYPLSVVDSQRKKSIALNGTAAKNGPLADDVEVLALPSLSLDRWVRTVGVAFKESQERGDRLILAQALYDGDQELREIGQIWRGTSIIEARRFARVTALHFDALIARSGPRLFERLSVRVDSWLVETRQRIGVSIPSKKIRDLVGLPGDRSSYFASLPRRERLGILGRQSWNLTKDGAKSPFKGLKTLGGAAFLVADAVLSGYKNWQDYKYDDPDLKIEKAVVATAYDVGTNLIATSAGAAVGSEVGGAIGGAVSGPAAPIGAAIGARVGGVVGGAAASWAWSKAQEWEPLQDFRAWVVDEGAGALDSAVDYVKREGEERLDAAGDAIESAAGQAVDTVQQGAKTAQRAVGSVARGISGLFR
jgi:hypothetical protein